MKKCLLVILTLCAAGLAPADDLARQFAQPPDSARPWVFAYWMEGNATREGITTDLEAMKRQGIGGLTFFDGALGNPQGPHRFMSDSWRGMFRHLVKEADRVGLEMNLNNDPGWAGSGGPWVTPEQASQRVVMSETILEGPAHFDAVLPLPADINHGYYRDIAVLAYPAPNGKPDYRIPGFDSTKSFSGKRDFATVVPWPRFISTDTAWPAVPAGHAVQAGECVDLSDRLAPDGRLTWEMPAGRWLVLRIGHSVANGEVRAAQIEAQGLECDKLSKVAVKAHFDAMVTKLLADAGELAGKTIVATHIDSWESGSGNWTAGFREEFRQRRGYDLLPYLPTLNGIAVDTREVSERFLWDFRETVSELLLQNYAAYFRELAQARGLRLTIEAYDAPADDLRYAGRADEPVAEFWQRPIYNGFPMCDLVEGMASASHVYGRNILGAESFTGVRQNYLDFPGNFKPMADWALCTGINRISFSQWIMQPWPRLMPGISFGEFGTAFNRGLTWWEMGRPWHDYVTRCQFMLRQGRFVADICYLTAEGTPQRFVPPIPVTERGGIPDRPAHNYDGCPPELILDPATRVESGEVVLPAGMRYRLLVLPSYNANGEPVLQLMNGGDYYYKAAPLPRIETMTPALLRRIMVLVEAGATVLGPRPLKSPSLAGFPQCDEEVKRLADGIWGAGAGLSGTGERRLGRGRVVWGITPEQVLAGMGVARDFTTDDALQGRLNYTHRRTAEGLDIYFVVNKHNAPVQGTAFFRSTEGTPELWWPQSGQRAPALFARAGNDVTRLPLSLQANESVFVVFALASGAPAAHTGVSRDGATLWPLVATAQAKTPIDDSFKLAAWVKPTADMLFSAKSEIDLPAKVEGGWAYAHEVQTPAYGYQTVTTLGQARRGFSTGSNGVVVFQYGPTGNVEPILVHEASITKVTHVAVTYAARIPRLYLDGKLVMTGPKNRFPEPVGFSPSDQRTFAGDIASIEQFDDMREAAGEKVRVPHPPAPVDFSRGEIWQSGRYVLTKADGTTQRREVTLPTGQELTGPWSLQFDPQWGGPARITFDRLDDWSKRPEPGIRFYSGTVSYRKSFTLAAAVGPKTRLYLDLGEVSAMAAVRLNGRDLGVLWNAPYRVDITDAVKVGAANELECKVVNLWANRLIGDEHLPEDSNRDAAGVLKEWPQWILEGKPSPTGRFTFITRRLWTKEDQPVKSGLLGPVRVIAAEKL